MPKKKHSQHRATSDTGSVFALAPDLAHQVLRREFAQFFTRMTTPEPGWPVIPHEAFVDALADSLVSVGERNGKGISFLETLTMELQDRVAAIRGGKFFWPNPATRLGTAGGRAVPRVYRGPAYWAAGDAQQSGEITRAIWIDDGLLLEGFGRLDDGSRFLFEARLDGNGEQYTGLAECTLQSSRECWSADVIIAHAEGAGELEGTWTEATTTGGNLTWSLAIELRSATNE